MRAIKVVNYDPSWPRLFAEISTEISILLGDRLLSIDHIGSTSVPGLAAKPKIDLDAVMISDEFQPTAIEVVRAFCPSDGIAEDPVTGSANAAIAAALFEAGRLKRGDRYSVSQGREVGRDGCVEVRIDEGGEVWIGGRVQAVIRGTVEW